ncbi:amidase [Bowmanella yangjiangensis]|uniref:Amidase n=1 Tax=Bowmanella yangjiangensis TaxID=2811230 RepID=A0ABS3CZG8_9ALTE|nr:amidase [Bowmanella yangjiangensis]MBN7822522.1 amidase [Bowmanella yangjiangensis]
MPKKSPLELGLRQLSQAITERQWSARDVTAAVLSRVEALDCDLHAFCTLDETAMAQAEDIDRRLGEGLPVGPLAGVPVAVKDLISTQGLRTTFGSRLYADFVPERDDIVVERLKAAGAIIIGKTNTSEFGYGGIGHNHVFPTTRNPWNTALTPGGSSAGSAAAVAARMVPLALGSDGGGSIRIPASLSGVFGMKPSWGRVPLFPGCRDERYPGQSGWESLEHIGPLTRTAADAAFALSVISGPSSLDRYSIPSQADDWILKDPGTLKNVRIAYSCDLGFAVVDPEVCAAFENAIKQLGAVIDAVECTHPTVGNTEGLLDTLVALETDRVGLKSMASDRGIKLDGWLGSILERTWSADQFTAALMERKRIINITAKFMGEFDFLLTPSTATGAFAADTYGPAEIAGRSLPPSAWVPFSALANFTGLPAASVPIGFTTDGRPIGLQVMGRHLDDRGVLSLSAVIEKLFQHDRWPGPPL